MYVPNFRNLGQFCVYSSSGQYVDSPFDLDIRQIDLKINRGHLHPETHVCAKFDKPRQTLCLVIIRTS